MVCELDHVHDYNVTITSFQTFIISLHLPAQTCHLPHSYKGIHGHVKINEALAGIISDPGSTK